MRYGIGGRDKQQEGDFGNRVLTGGEPEKVVKGWLGLGLGLGLLG